MNKHRGSDFNEFLAQENLMTPTPRTDEEAEYWIDPAMSGEHQIVPADFARQLEREIAGCREWSSKLADFVDDLRAELATERELADRLADHLDTALGAFDNQEAPHVVRANRTLAAWKEARRGTV